jgi:hypothetical protein
MLFFRIIKKVKVLRIGEIVLRRKPTAVHFAAYIHDINLQQPLLVLCGSIDPGNMLLSPDSFPPVFFHMGSYQLITPFFAIIIIYLSLPGFRPTERKYKGKHFFHSSGLLRWSESP